MCHARSAEATTDRPIHITIALLLYNASQQTQSIPIVYTSIPNSTRQHPLTADDEGLVCNTTSLHIYQMQRSFLAHIEAIILGPSDRIGQRPDPTPFHWLCGVSPLDC